MNEHAQQLESLLFGMGRPLARADVAKMLGVSVEEVETAVAGLREKKGGIVLVDDGRMLELRTAPESAPLIERVRKEEYSRDIGRAGLEALAAVLYRGPLTRSDIDFIRGVNSSQTLRTLLMRGLVRKIENNKERTLPAGRRGSFLYEPTTELLSQLGVAGVSDLPEYAAVQKKLQELEAAYRLSSAGTDSEDSPPHSL